MVGIKRGRRTSGLCMGGQGDRQGGIPSGDGGEVSVGLTTPVRRRFRFASPVESEPSKRH